MSIFEIIMLLCFGVSWPISIHKTFTLRSTKGKSLMFSCVAMAGYVAGILHKIFYQPDLVIILYIFNLLMIITDIILFYRNLRIEKKSTSSEKIAMTI